MATLTALPPAVQARIAKIYRDFGRILDSADPTDYAVAFHPTAEDDEWAAQTSPLNRLDDEARALDAMFADEDQDEAFDRYVEDREADHEPTAGAWGGHPDHLDN